MCFLWCHNCSMNKDLPVTLWWMNGGNLGDILRPLEAHFRLLLNRWENRPAGILRFKEWTTTVIGGAPVGAIPSLSPTTRGCARELVCRLPRHRAIPLTALPGGIARGGSGVCVCSITDTYTHTHAGNFYRHNHNKCTGNLNTNRSLCVKTHTQIKVNRL